MSRHRHVQELYEQPIMHARFNHWKLLWKNTHLMMWALCNSLTRRYLPATHIITHCTQLPQQRKTQQQNPFARHQCSVTVSDDVSWQVKISLHHSDNYLSQVKINVKTVNNTILKISREFFIFHQDSARAHRVRETISFLACNLAKCWLVLVAFSALTLGWAAGRASGL